VNAQDPCFRAFRADLARPAGVVAPQRPQLRFLGGSSGVSGASSGESVVGGASLDGSCGAVFVSLSSRVILC